jgi:CRISPR-associated protein Cmr2
VQSFIAQARRTRDFWTGSFILSWLSAVAMKAVLAQDKNNEIIFPEADKDYLLWLEDGEGKSNHPPEHGGVPNRFKACVHGHFEPEAVIKSVNAAWQALAEKIYNGDLARFNNAKTKEIWNIQVKTFWDMSWVLVLTDDAKDSAALDVRKNWRSYLPPEQAGVKCMMMEGWQELSGAIKPSEEVRLFWQKVRNNGAKGMKTDFREKEQLCAIAFIKRRFPHYFDKKLVVDMPNGWTLKGWTVKAGRPSVAYMAAVHWLKQVLKEASNNNEIAEQLWRFHDVAIELTDGNHNEWDNQIQCIADCKTPRKWQSLDGNVFFDFTLENPNIYDDQQQAKQVLKELKALQTLLPDLKPATPFYAVLMMDGDSLGKQMSDTDKQTAITDGLKKFTDSVPALVQKHNGFLIYAGGDDVLALLPLEDALGCALEIREEYKRIFEGLNKNLAEDKQVFTSISAAVVFAHIKIPLTKVLKTAHSLLDDVAKDEYGRDALAVSVWKAGGRVLQWARPWNEAIENKQWDKAIENKQLVLERLAEKFANDDKTGQLSNRFLYKIRERFELLNPPPDKKNQTDDQAKESVSKTPVLSGTQAIDLMAAEYFSSGLCETGEEKATHAEKMTHAKTVVTPLLEQCRPIYRKLDDTNRATFEPDSAVLVDAALLIRFLAQKGLNL